MTGHHEVRIFWITTTREYPFVMPTGWKPFSTVYEADGSGLVGVMARKWVRDAKEIVDVVPAIAE